MVFWIHITICLLLCYTPALIKWPKFIKLGGNLSVVHREIETFSCQKLLGTSIGHPIQLKKGWCGLFLSTTTDKVRIRDPSRTPQIFQLGDVWEGSEAEPWISRLTQIVYTSTTGKGKETGKAWAVSPAHPQHHMQCGDCTLPTPNPVPGAAAKFVEPRAKWQRRALCSKIVRHVKVATAEH